MANVKKHHRPSPLHALRKPKIYSPCLFIGEGKSEKGFLSLLLSYFAQDVPYTLKSADGANNNKWVEVLKKHSSGHAHCFMIFDGDVLKNKKLPFDKICADKVKNIINIYNPRIPIQAIIFPVCLEELLLCCMNEKAAKSSDQCKSMFAACCAAKGITKDTDTIASNLTLEEWQIVLPLKIVNDASTRIQPLHELVTFIKDIK